MNKLQKYMLYNISALLLLLGAIQIQATTDWNITYCNDGICYNPLQPSISLLNGTGTTDHITKWDGTTQIGNSEMIENNTGLHISQNITMHYDGEGNPTVFLLDAPPVGIEGDSCFLNMDSSVDKNSTPLILESNAINNSATLQYASRVSTTGSCGGTATCATSCSLRWPICAVPCSLTTNKCLLGQRRCYFNCASVFNQFTCEAYGCTWTPGAAEKYDISLYTDDDTDTTIYTDDATDISTFYDTDGCLNIEQNGPVDSSLTLLTDDGEWQVEQGISDRDTGNWELSDDILYWDDSGFGAMWADSSGFYIEDIQPYGNTRDYILAHHWENNQPVMIIDAEYQNNQPLILRLGPSSAQYALEVQNDSEDTIMKIDYDGSLWASYIETSGSGNFYAGNDALDWNDGSIGFLVDNTGVFFDTIDNYHETNLTIQQANVLINAGAELVCTAENALCEETDTNTWWTLTGYMINDSENLNINETMLNATINALDDDTTYTHLTNFTNDLTIMSNTINYLTNNITNITMTTYSNGCYRLSNATGLYDIC